MDIFINKTEKLHGLITAPSSKSHSVRALIIATLAKGTSVLHNVLYADDTKAAIGVCKGLGALIKQIKPSCHDFCLKVESRGIPLQTNKNSLFSGNSGITTTFALPLIGLRKNCAKPMQLGCGGQMQKRPLKPIVDALNNLGMRVQALKKNSSCPLKFDLPLKGGFTEVDGLNSQYLSALLLGLPCAPEDSTVVVKNLHERPYVDMTLAWLKEQKIRYSHHKKEGKDVFQIVGGQTYKPFQTAIPGDFSSASYVIAAAVLLPGKIIVHGLNMDDPQGDKKLIFLLEQMGADILIQKQKMTIFGGKLLQGANIDCGDIPDLLPILAIIGTQAKGKTTLYNIAHARIKETDRLHSMAENLKLMGARVEEKKDKMVIYNGPLHGAKMSGYNDHRTVMALTVGAMCANGESRVDTAQSIKKTWPDFVKVMRSIGANVSINKK